MTLVAFQGIAYCEVAFDNEESGTMFCRSLRFLGIHMDRLPEMVSESKDASARDGFWAKGDWRIPLDVGFRVEAANFDPQGRIWKPVQAIIDVIKDPTRTATISYGRDAGKYQGKVAYTAGGTYWSSGRPDRAVVLMNGERCAFRHTDSSLTVPATTHEMYHVACNFYGDRYSPSKVILATCNPAESMHVQMVWTVDNVVDARYRRQFLQVVRKPTRPDLARYSKQKLDPTKFYCFGLEIPNNAQRSKHPNWNSSYWPLYVPCTGNIRR